VDTNHGSRSESSNQSEDKAFADYPGVGVRRPGVGV